MNVHRQPTPCLQSTYQASQKTEVTREAWGPDHRIGLASLPKEPGTPSLRLDMRVWQNIKKRIRKAGHMKEVKKEAVTGLEMVGAGAL